MAEDHIKVRFVGKGDIPEIVRIHKEAFPLFFLTSLGDSFLKLYYRSLIKNKDGLAVCAVGADSGLLGFCAGAVKSAGFHKRLIMQSPFSFGFVFIKLLISRPRAVARLFLNLQKQSSDEVHTESAELLSIGVRKSSTGQGVGKILTREFENELRGKGVKMVTLTTDYYFNDQAVKFYLKTGYEIYFDFVTYPERRMYKMCKNL